MVIVGEKITYMNGPVTARLIVTQLDSYGFIQGQRHFTARFGSGAEFFPNYNNEGITWVRGWEDQKAIDAMIVAGAL